MAIHERLEAGLESFGWWVIRWRWSAIAICLMLSIGLISGLRFFRIDNSDEAFLPKSDPERVRYEAFKDEYDSDERINGLHDPDVMRRVEQAMRRAETLEVGGRKVSQTYSLVDIVKETHQALNENRPGFYRLPGERLLLAQELLLFENSGSDDLEELTDSQFSQAHMSLRTHWVDAMEMPPFLERLATALEDVFGPGIEFEFTGGGVLFSRIFENVITTLARSYAFALVIITPLMILLIGNFRRGLVAMIPNLIPVFLVLALMGALGIPLDMTTLLIGGVVIGLAVDDTIHFMHKFNRYYSETGDPRAAVQATLATTGSALLFTSVVLGLGFSVFMAAYMVNIAWFGVLLTFSVVVAFLADVTLAPALMMFVAPTRNRVDTRGPECGLIPFRLQRSRGPRADRWSRHSGN